LANAQAALRWLEKDNVAEVREGLNGIVTDGHRASDIIKNLRAMFKNDVQEKTFVDINKLILSVLALVQIDLQNQNRTQNATRRSNSGGPRQSGSVAAGNFEPGHECQRVDGFIANADTAHKDQTGPFRYGACVDQGHRAGIKQSDIARLFQPMFTTKTRGMGMGLSICQSIIENHDGRIWASPGVNGGTIFQFELPTLAVRPRQAELV
ncbi:MAG: sensor histidine kinase, partial [Pseudolabrys sp.]